MKSENIHKVRIDLAIEIASSDPSLVNLVQARIPLWKDAKQEAKGKILKSLMKLEPSIGHIFKYYGKRERA